MGLSEKWMQTRVPGPPAKGHCGYPGYVRGLVGAFFRGVTANAKALLIVNSLHTHQNRLTCSAGCHGTSAVHVCCNAAGDQMGEYFMQTNYVSEAMRIVPWQCHSVGGLPTLEVPSRKDCDSTYQGRVLYLAVDSYTMCPQTALSIDPSTITASTNLAEAIINRRDRASRNTSGYDGT